MEKLDICSFDLEELTAFLESLSQPKYRAKQIFKWLQSGIDDFGFDIDRDLISAITGKSDDEDFAAGMV